MKIVNINLHFYPESVGGAAVVAEKLAWGLVQAGHEVTNVFLSLTPGNGTFKVFETPFGRSIGIKNVARSPANRFFNPPATSALREIVDIVGPDRIFVHAAQHMGIHELLSDPAILGRTCIVAHDPFWLCLQGFRTLPDGSSCSLVPGPAACRQCAWFPGLTENIYAASRDILAGSRAVVFPSQYLHSTYAELLGNRLGDFVVQANPDVAESVIPDVSALGPAAGAQAKAAGKTVFGFVGGPGETKGWSVVREFMKRAEQVSAAPGGPHVVLFDIGRSTNAPWYPRDFGPGTTVADGFHWTFARDALSQIDVMLMPSRVRESFGLAAREILSLGKSCLIRPSGALAELRDCRGVAVVEDGDDVDSLLAKLEQSEDPRRSPWRGTSITTYVEKLMSL